jgi:hypothetical protein
MVAQTIHTGMLIAGTGGSISNLVTYVIAAGASLTAGQCFAALYDASGNRLAVSADISSALTSASANNPLVIPFSSSATIAVGDKVYAALLANGTTMPQLGRCGTTASAATGNAGMTATTGFRYGRFGTTATSMPSTFSVSTQTAGTNLWFGLS